MIANMDVRLPSHIILPEQTENKTVERDVAAAAGNRR